MIKNYSETMVRNLTDRCTRLEHVTEYVRETVMNLTICKDDKDEVETVDELCNDKENETMIKNSEDGKTLFVGSSIGHHFDFNVLGENGLLEKHVRAYTAVEDKNARFPESNFSEIVWKNLEEDNYKYLIIQGGSIEITNLNTQENVLNNISTLFPHHSLGYVSSERSEEQYYDKNTNEKNINW